MSLILDALRKLERDRSAPEPGVVVVGAVPWEGERRPRRSLALFAATLALAAAGAGALWLARSRPAAPHAVTPPPSAPVATTAPAEPAPAVPRFDDVGAPPAPRRLVVPGRASAHEPAPAAPTQRPTPLRDLRLVAISERDGRPVAMINDHLVFEGDSFEGVRVLRITGTEVEVEVRGERRVLRF